MPVAEAAAFWKAAALLRFDRRRALDGLAASFATGFPPQDPAGAYWGRFLTTTVGWGLDPALTALAAIWMPWRGKVLDPAAGEGRNRFTRGGGRVIAWRFRHYRDIRPSEAGEVTAFRFATSVGPSATAPGQPVLRLDYDVPDNPSWLVRRVLDELVAVDNGLYLGQALLRGGRRCRRAAWFFLEK